MLSGIRCVRPPLAFMLANCFGWVKANDLEEAQAHVWKRVAYACRYGNTGLEALHLPMESLGSLNQALSKIIQEENESNKS